MLQQTFLFLLDLILLLLDLIFPVNGTLFIFPDLFQLYTTVRDSSIFFYRLVLMINSA